MKKINLDAQKLQLNKQKITNLTNEEMSMVNGGRGFLSIFNCNPSNGSCTCESKFEGACTSKPSGACPTGVPPVSDVGQVSN